jgi:alpha-D-ribose 1-methylphosphonate 5-triphosphate diphosphatase
MERIILSNARIVAPDRDFIGSVVIEDGGIADLIEGKTYDDADDLRGLWLCPGLVDLHSDYFEKEINPRPGTGFPLSVAMHFLDLRAASAGITSLFDSISFRESDLEGRTVDRAIAMSRALNDGALAGNFLIRHFLHARLEVTERRILEAVDEIRGLEILREVAYNEHVPGIRQHRDTDAYAKRVARRVGKSVEEVAASLAKRADRIEEAGETRRRIHEKVRSLPDAGRILIASHDDFSIEDVDEAVSFGARLIEFPTSFEAADHSRSLGLDVAMGAPNFVLGFSQSGNISCREAIDRGLVDILCSDYHFPSMLVSAVMLIERGWSPSKAVNLVSLNPARTAGIDGELGSIEVGKKADLVVFGAAGGMPRVRRVYIDGVPCLSTEHPLNRRPAEKEPIASAGLAQY